MPTIFRVLTTIGVINLAHPIGLFDIVFDLSSLFNRYPSYQRPSYYGGNGFYQGGGFYPNTGYNSQGGFAGYPQSGYGGSGLGTNVLGKKNDHITCHHGRSFN